VLEFGKHNHKNNRKSGNDGGLRWTVNPFPLD